MTALASSPSPRTSRRSSSSEILFNDSSDQGYDSGDSDDFAQPQLVAKPNPNALPAAFRYAFHIVAAADEALGFGKLSQSLLGGRLVVSTHFSGVGCAEIALNMLQPALNDKSAKSRRVLRMRFPDACIYGDIFDYVPDLPAWEALAKLTPTQRQAQVDERYQGGGRHCCSHQAACAPRVAHGDIAGSPCPPWSAAGARKGWGDSRTVCTQVWVAHIKTTLPDFCVHENVPPFPAEYISEQLQEEYHIFHVSSNVSDLSWNVVRRKRVFSCLLRRQAVSLIADVALLYQQICRQVAQRMAPLSVTDICVATLEELLCEENKVRSRKKLPLARSQLCDTLAACFGFQADGGSYLQES
ncbi:unnamed protein product [Effrenium voratum]|nr:unnamed protein product [Effrenium voratum]